MKSVPFSALLMLALSSACLGQDISPILGNLYQDQNGNRAVYRGLDDAGDGIWGQSVSSPNSDSRERLRGNLYDGPNGNPAVYRGKDSNENNLWEYLIVGGRYNRGANGPLSIYRGKDSISGYIWDSVLPVVSQLAQAQQAQLESRPELLPEVQAIGIGRGQILTIAAILMMAMGVLSASMIRKFLWKNQINKVFSIIFALSLGLLGAFIQSVIAIPWLEVSNLSNENSDPMSILRNGMVTLFVVTLFSYKILNSEAKTLSSANINTGSDKDWYWEQAYNEAEGENRNKALWAKALVSAEGNQSVAKSKYIELRVPQVAKADLDARVVECQGKLELLGYSFFTDKKNWKVTEPYGKTHNFNSIEELEDFTLIATPTK